MTPRHEFYLSLGSNIQPDAHLSGAIERLREHGKIQATSSVWESAPVGAAGPNFLNLCLLFVGPHQEEELRQEVLRPIEHDLGRVRTQDKNAPRTIDIDILMVDGAPVHLRRWAYAFVLMPMAELLPNFSHPVTDEPLSEAARRTRMSTWIVQRPDVLNLQTSQKSN